MWLEWNRRFDALILDAWSCIVMSLCFNASSMFFEINHTVAIGTNVRFSMSKPACVSLRRSVDLSWHRNFPLDLNFWLGGNTHGMLRSSMCPWIDSIPLDCNETFEFDGNFDGAFACRISPFMRPTVSYVEFGRVILHDFFEVYTRFDGLFLSLFRL